MKTKLHSAVAFTSSDMDTIFELGSHMHLNEPISLCPFSNDSEEEFKCVVCFMLLHDPIQLECCGLNVCKRCMEMFANSEENTVCPRCRTSLFEWFEDKRIAKKITNLKMHCPLKCGWNGQFEDQQRHLETECDLACAKCNKCREIVRLKERNVHNKDRCKHVLCKCCSNNFPVAQFARHKCSNQIVKCEFRGDSTFPRWYEDIHAEICKKRPVECVLFHKCRQTVERQHELAHLTSCVGRHKSDLFDIYNMLGLKCYSSVVNIKPVECGWLIGEESKTIGTDDDMIMFENVFVKLDVIQKEKDDMLGVIVSFESLNSDMQTIFHLLRDYTLKIVLVNRLCEQESIGKKMEIFTHPEKGNCFKCDNVVNRKHTGSNHMMGTQFEINDTLLFHLYFSKILLCH